MSEERGRVSDATREAEAEEALAPHGADVSDGADETDLEDREVDDEVRSHYREMTELGAHEVGEGRVP
jgi:hypothetical protein